uniref:ADF-H domain-containing protein n=1 Tax=Anas platyrhynchos platyrhynchos TaxID=8840 RepID=A0A493TF89_ANAPP
MATKIDKEACREAYNLVRDDATEVNWVTFKYNGSTIVPGDQGVDYETFKRKCTGKLPLAAFDTSGIPRCPGKLQFVPPLLPRALSCMAGSSAVTESNLLKSLQ